MKSRCRRARKPNGARATSPRTTTWLPSAGHGDATIVEIESDERRLRLQPMRMLCPCRAVDDAQVTAPATEIANNGREKFAEPSKPEVSRLGATRQLEGTCRLHRLAS